MKAPEPRRQTTRTGTDSATRLPFAIGLLLLVLTGCAGQATRASRPREALVRAEGARSKGTPALESATVASAQLPRNGLPALLLPLPTLPVRHLAFANDAAQRSSADAHAAGAIEDEHGVTICLVVGPLSVPDGSIIVHPSPFSSAAQSRCFREDDARIARSAKAVVGKVGEDISFVLNLERSEGTTRRAYSFGSEVRAREAQVRNAPKRNHESVGRPPPWPRSLEDEIKRAARTVRGYPRVALPDARKVSDLKPVAAPTWLALLQQNSELETRTLIDDEALVLAITLARASAADSEPAREVLIAREGPRWVSSQAVPAVFVQGARAPSLGPGVLLVLTRMLNGGSNSSRRTLYSDQAQMRIMSSLHGELVEHGNIALGEVGYTRLAGKNRVWRAFNQARVTAPGCLLVRRDHAFTALFDTRVAKVSERSRLALGIEGLPPEVVTRYAKTEGKYHFDGRQLTRGPCP